MANFVGTNGNDVLPPLGVSNTGNDIFSPLLGNDVVDGGDGDDLLILDYSSNVFAGGGGFNPGLVSSVNNDGLGSFSGNFYAYNSAVGGYDNIAFSNIERFQITGTNQNDNIAGGSNNDTLNGGGGDDTFFAIDGVDQIDGGTGINTLQFANLSNVTNNLTIDGLGTTITASNGTTIKNVERFNNLWTGSGNDTITFTVRYDELIRTGIGNDSINGGLGKDNIDGQGGSDLLIINYSSNNYGGTLAHPAGINSYFFSNGASGWSGSLSAYYADADSSYDRVDFYNIERFQITGTGAGDTLSFGGYGKFSIDGGTGNDTVDRADFSAEITDLTIDNSGVTITQSNGTVVKNVERFNNLWTGSGNDTINFAGATRYNKSIYTGNGNDNINAGLGNNYVDGGTGSDLLNLNYSGNSYAVGVLHAPGMNASFSSNGTGGWNGYIFAYYADVDGSYDQVNFNNIEKLNLIGTGVGDYFSYGGYGNFSIDGGGGNDTIDRADFSLETTALTLNSLGATVTQSNGTVVKNVERFTNLWTGTGKDIINFSVRYGENINTGLGDDNINSGLGYDAVDGGGGTDLLIINYASNAYAGGALTAGINSSIYDNGSGSWNGSFSAQYADVPGNYDYVNFSNIERFQITGTGQNDNISTGSGNDLIVAGVGNDTIHSGGGIDTVDGGTGVDVLVDTNFSDVVTNLTINNGTVLQTLSNGFKITSIERFANLITGTGNDTLNFTGRYDDQVNTGIGNDTINLGLGRDSVDGDFGDDLLTVNYSSNVYAGNGTFAAGIQWNYFYYQGFSGSYSGSLFAYTDTSGNYDQVNFSNIERFNITGTVGNDTLYGGVGNDVLSGVGGNDSLDAGGGNDSLNGGAGNDTLKGGKGNDVYVVDSVNDIVTENANEGTDTIQSSITLSLVTLPNIENLTLTGSGAINGTGNAGNNTLLGNAVSNTLNGGDGKDVLTGGGGKDVLTGGIGIDRFGYKTLADSLLGATNNGFDQITDFNANVGNDLFLVTTARTAFTAGLTVATLDAAGIGAALTAVNFAANSAAQFTFGSGLSTRTFVAINDATAGFVATIDAIVEVTGLTGTLAIGNFVTV